MSTRLHGLRRPSSSNEKKSASSDSGTAASEFFPLTLHEMINYYHTHDPAVMGWTEDGKCFYVISSAENVGKAIKKFFSHGRFASLRRQLCAYRFRRERSSCVWQHDIFSQHSSRDDMSNIQRGRVKRTDKPKKRKMSTDSTDVESPVEDSPSPPRPKKKKEVPVVKVEVKKNCPLSPLRASDRLRQTSHQANQSSSIMSPGSTHSDLLSPRRIVPKETPFSPMFTKENVEVKQRRHPARGMAKFFCRSCRFYEGSICCGQCPQEVHGDCKTSRCVAQFKSV